jgi:hypothetical protein
MKNTRWTKRNSRGNFIVGRKISVSEGNLSADHVQNKTRFDILLENKKGVSSFYLFVCSACSRSIFNDYAGIATVRSISTKRIGPLCGMQLLYVETDVCCLLTCVFPSSSSHFHRLAKAKTFPENVPSGADEGVAIPSAIPCQKKLDRV